jgi:serpin B
MALTMTYNGADGKTKTAMEEALRLRGLDIDEINAGNASLLAALAGREPDLVLTVANSLWAREGMPFDEAFFKRVARYFNAEVESLPFDNAAKDRINAWVSEATNGKIDSILDSISPNDILYIINAIYLKASWVYQFQEEATKDETFHNGNGSEVTVPMMHQGWAKYGYLDGDGFTAVHLPYKGGASMYVFLPDEGSSLPEFMDDLNPESWAEWMDGFEVGGGDIALPRFEMEYEATLNDVLSAMGMEVAFDGGADFSKMGPGGAYISYVKHKAVIEVHEKGTEAAAVTIVAITTSAPIFRFDFRADRPFFHAIVDDRTGSVLFAGTVYEL